MRLNNRKKAMISWLAFALSLVAFELAHAQTTRPMAMAEWTAFQNLLEGARKLARTFSVSRRLLVVLRHARRVL